MCGDGLGVRIATAGRDIRRAVEGAKAWSIFDLGGSGIGSVVCAGGFCADGPMRVLRLILQLEERCSDSAA